MDPKGQVVRFGGADIADLMASMYQDSQFCTTLLLCIERPLAVFAVTGAYAESVYMFCIKEGKAWDGLYVVSCGLGMQGPVWHLDSVPEGYAGLTQKDFELLEELHE